MFYLDYQLFFFSSRRRHTRLTCDWSSDVCSSDLHRAWPKDGRSVGDARAGAGSIGIRRRRVGLLREDGSPRSEERRVGKECRTRWRPFYRKNKIWALYAKVSSIDGCNYTTRIKVW